MIKVNLIILGLSSLGLLCLSLWITGIIGNYGGTFYLFTLPFLIIAGLCVISSVIGILSTPVSLWCFWPSAIFNGSLFIPYLYAKSKWPGGDDGPGLAWGWLAGGASIIALLISIILICIVLILKVS